MCLLDLEKGYGPEKSLFILGYASWDPGQLEYELKENDWIVVDPAEDLIFDKSPQNAWKKALGRSGVGRLHIHQFLVTLKFKD